MSSNEAVIAIPKLIVDKIRGLGVDLESYIVEILLQELKLDPGDEARVHLELAEKYSKEGSELIDRDPVQASEKLYKAAEEAVKALTLHLKLEDIVKKVQSRGRWTVTELEKAVEMISERIGTWFLSAWDTAWTLHIWGFHEAKLNGEAVKRRIQYIREIVEETGKLIRVS